MIDRYIFRENLKKDYVQNFNDYVLSILYGGNILIGDDIEDEWKDVPVDD